MENESDDNKNHPKHISEGRRTTLPRHSGEKPASANHPAQQPDQPAHLKKAKTIPGLHLFKRKNEILNFWLDVVLNIVIIVGMVIIIRSYLISPFQVYGPSMCNTLNFIDGQCQHSYGEYIIVNKLGYQNFFGLRIGLPKRGDIIVFRPPRNKDEFFIKRIIGLPGETVKLKNGDVYIFNKEKPEGFKLDEKYLSFTNQGNTMPLGGISLFEVPADQYFALGDNRVASSDSRSCFKESPTGEKCGQGEVTPYLPLENIEGKAWIVLWPLSKLQILPDPEY